jgi:hypothetical protein
MKWALLAAFSLIVSTNCGCNQMGLHDRTDALIKSKGDLIKLRLDGTEPDDEQKLEAFRTSVHMVSVKYCATCHRSPPLQPGLPEFAQDDLASAYLISKNLVQFGSVNNSKLVLRANDNHCGIAAFCNGHSDEMAAAVTIWKLAEGL